MTRAETEFRPGSGGDGKESGGDCPRFSMVGVGKDKSNVIGHVLGKFDPETRKTMDLVVAEAVKTSAAILRDGPDRAMNAYNGFDAVKPA